MKQNKDEEDQNQSSSEDQSSSLMKKKWDEPSDKTQQLSSEYFDENCLKWAMKILKNARISRIMQDFRDNKDWKPTKMSTTICDRNFDKNRYKGIQCADENRVILKDRNSENDYIHASWMIMPDKTHFISTQAPLKNTATDFWHMIYTEKCRVIVMLCHFIEDGAEKCFKYFGDDLEFGEYRLKIVEKTIDWCDSVKYTQIELRRNSLKQVVHHFWYHNWPDQIAPLSPMPMIKMYQSAMEKCASMPIVVHCSAGVGRTSTFIGIHLGCEMIREDPSIDLIDILRELRKMRLCSIQSQLQYVFLLISILQLLIERQIIPRDSGYDSLVKKYTDITKKVSAAIQEEEEKKKKKKSRKMKQEATGGGAGGGGGGEENAKKKIVDGSLCALIGKSARSVRKTTKNSNKKSERKKRTVKKPTF